MLNDVAEDFLKPTRLQEDLELLAKYSYSSQAKFYRKLIKIVATIEDQSEDTLQLVYVVFAIQTVIRAYRSRFFEERVHPVATKCKKLKNLKTFNRLSETVSRLRNWLISQNVENIKELSICYI